MVSGARSTALGEPAQGGDLHLESGTAELAADTELTESAQQMRRWYPSLLRAGAPVWILAVVALLCLALGFALGGVVLSPDDAASHAQPPAVGLITAPVEKRQIVAVINTRADVEFADRVVVNPPIPAGAEAAVVTGRVPEVGTKVTAGMVLLEVSGRPVFVLPGNFPAYRTMGTGSVGPDVAQLRKALGRLGYAVGKAGKAYDAALSKAVRQLYVDAGYPAPNSEDVDLATVVQSAADSLDDAQEARKQATKQLTAAQKLLGAERTAAVAEAKQALKLAKRDQTRAAAALASAQKAAWTPMPIGEVVFLSGLPRRVDAVNVKLGQDLAAASGADAGDSGEVSGAVVLSGAQITVTAIVSDDESKLLKLDAPVELAAMDSSIITGKVSRLCDDASLNEESKATSDCEIGIALNGSAPIDKEALVGNILASIQVGSTSDDALVVPVAAVSADSSGRARIEVVAGALIKDVAAAEQPTQQVTFEAGISAEGYVEILSSEPALKVGDLVVVGRAATAQSPTPEPSR